MLPNLPGMLAALTHFRTIRLIESKDMLSGKGPIRITKSNSWPYIGHPKNQITPEIKCTMCLSICPNTSWTLIKLGAVSSSLGSLFLCPATLWIKNFFWYPTWTSQLRFMPFPWDLSLITSVKRSVSVPPLSLTTKLQMEIRSLLSLREAEWTKWPQPLLSFPSSPLIPQSSLNTLIV